MAMRPPASIGGRSRAEEQEAGESARERVVQFGVTVQQPVPDRAVDQVRRPLVIGFRRNLSPFGAAAQQEGERFAASVELPAERLGELRVEPNWASAMSRVTTSPVGPARIRHISETYAVRSVRSEPVSGRPMPSSACRSSASMTMDGTFRPPAVQRRLADARLHGDGLHRQPAIVLSLQQRIEAMVPGAEPGALRVNAVSPGVVNTVGCRKNGARLHSGSTPAKFRSGGR